MDTKDLLKDKRFQIAAVATAGIGGLVFFMRKKNGSATDAATAASAIPSGSVGGQFTGAGAYDSSGNDIASWLGQYSNGLNDQLAQWSGNLSDTLTAIKDQSDSKAGYWAPDDWFYTSPGGQSWTDVAKIALPNGSASARDVLAAKLAADNAAASVGSTTRAGQIVHIGSGADYKAAGF